MYEIGINIRAANNSYIYSLMYGLMCDMKKERDMDIIIACI